MKASSGNRSFSHSELKSVRYQDLESKASQMKLINHRDQRAFKKRQSAIPAQVLKDKEFIFGIKSDIINPDKFAYSTITGSGQRSSHYRDGGSVGAGVG